MGFFIRSHSCIKYTLMIFSLLISHSITPFIYSSSMPSFCLNVLSQRTQFIFKTVYGACYYKLKRGKTVHNKNRFILREACAKNYNFKFLFV